LPDEVDEWAALDEVLGVESIDLPENSLGPLAFYGRCSTEDNQDPETSLGWQLGNASKFVEPLGGVVVAEYFDVGQSRSVPWDRRDDARRLLSDLKDPNRGWDAVVVGQGTWCWFGKERRRANACSGHNVRHRAALGSAQRADSVHHDLRDVYRGSVGNDGSLQRPARFIEEVDLDLDEAIAPHTNGPSCWNR
jgi:hypothetical protein